MRAVKSNIEERAGIGKFIAGSLYATLISLVALIILCAIFSLISLKLLLYPNVERIVCYIIYALAGAVCGYISVSQVNRLGIIASILGGVVMTLILYFGGFMLDGHSVAFVEMLKMMGILTGASVAGGVIRMYTKRE